MSAVGKLPSNRRPGSAGGPRLELARLYNRKTAQYCASHGMDQMSAKEVGAVENLRELCKADQEFGPWVWI